MFDSVNPTSGAVLRSYPEISAADLNDKLNAAVRAQRAWAKSPVPQRSALLHRIADVLRDGVDQWAGLITLEMGKPISEAEAEILKCAWCCDFYADNAERFLEPEIAPSAASESYIVLDPLGVVLAIMPWNFPFWQFFRFAAPSIAAGNGMVLKHASNVPQCAEAIEQVMRRAGAPEGLMANLFIHHSKVAALIDDPRIAALTLTGSTDVGSVVAGQAGRALKKQVLELGGSDPFIVLADADVEAAAAVAVKARFHNAGQSCVCAKRFIVEDSVADAFVEAMLAGIAALKIGDPAQRDVHVGPMARDNLRRDLADQVTRSIAGGAVVRAGGAPLDGAGFFFAPTLLDHVTPDMAAFSEETFGPVAAVIRVKDADEAIELANATEFGLGAALWTRDIARAKQLARDIEAGAVFINGQVASDPRLPFGGIKRSGYGRELGIHGLREFTNIKTVWIGPAQPQA
ncbi:MAG TPA: NAD-dependent succinate-semialdehyde dehydrogenase [Ancylobacter sp.]